jgi:hypothetical protein
MAKTVNGLPQHFRWRSEQRFPKLVQGIAALASANGKRSQRIQSVVSYVVGFPFACGSRCALGHTAARSLPLRQIKIPPTGARRK